MPIARHEPDAADSAGDGDAGHPADALASAIPLSTPMPVVAARASAERVDEDVAALEGAILRDLLQATDELEQ